MNTFLLFLRGVMPTGKNRVPMADLRAALTKHGFQAVQTWIQSGNVLVKTTLSAEETAKQTREIIKTEIGPDLPVIVKTAKQLKDILNANPFATEPIQDRVFYTLFSDRLEQEKAEALARLDVSPEKLVIKDIALYLFIPGSAARSRLSNTFLEKKLGCAMTTRNRNTITKMIQLGEEADAKQP